MRLRNSYANVVSTLALLVAVSGGAAVAAGELGRNTVGTKQLKNDAVVSKKVEDGSLLSADFAAGQLPAGPQGPAGARGLQGLQGVQGVQGVPGNTGSPGANAASYVGFFNDQGNLNPYTCYKTNLQANGIKVGDTVILAPDYNGVVGPQIQVSAGRATVANNVPYTICNISGTVVGPSTLRVDVYRVVGPAGAKPGPELSAQGAR